MYVLDPQAVISVLAAVHQVRTALLHALLCVHELTCSCPQVRLFAAPQRKLNLLWMVGLPPVTGNVRP